MIYLRLYLFFVIHYNTGMTPRLSLLLAFLLSVTGGLVFSQNRADPLWNYNTGRDAEINGRRAEADSYYNEAVQICNLRISRNIAAGDTYVVLTWALQRLRKYTDVISWGARGLGLYPDEHRIVETMGEAYFYLENYDESLLYMQRFTNVVPRGERTSVAYFFIGEIHRLREQFRHADIAYTTAVRLEPGVALWWFRLGSVREAAGDYLQAIDAYERAIRINSNYREAADGLARSRRQMTGGRE